MYKHLHTSCTFIDFAMLCSKAETIVECPHYADEISSYGFQNAINILLFCAINYCAFFLNVGDILVNCISANIVGFLEAL